ncbi:GNAT family N-acetyltransferase [Candidatus Peregrinibacteria bacterium]|nr:MAG: GNAT family N-acetyltransferase [Candidatus Peregrinibacteria bacterium]
MFELEGLRPDYLKVYPTMVTPFSDLEKMLKDDPSIHTPYTDDQLIDLVTDLQKHTPEYCRIIRIIRDIPAESIIIGSKTSNLRQIMERRGVFCRCVRCREIQDTAFDVEKVELMDRPYRAGDGQEHFISIEEPTLDKLIGLCRLRLPDHSENALFEELKGAALIRELHVYGRQQSLNEAANSAESKTQHTGFGRRLMEKAEAMAKESGYSRIVVIAAIGTREYYRKLGYELEGSYMVKSL